MIDKSRLQRHGLTRGSFWKGFLAAVFLVSIVGNVLSEMPVVVGHSFEYVKQPAASVQRRHVRFYKIRDCFVVPDSEIGWAMVRGRWYEVPFVFLPKSVPDEPLPDPVYGRDLKNRAFSWFEELDLGVWEWDLRTLSRLFHPKEIQGLRTTVFHNCSGTLKVTIIGPEFL